jgi:hypothetical protein
MPLAALRPLLGLAALLALAGCASLPQDDELLASASIVRELKRETGAVVSVGRFSALAPGAALPEGWRPWGANSGKRPTLYRIAAADGISALEAVADGGATGLHRQIRVDPRRQPVLEWRWRVDQLIPGADKRYAARDDSAARVVVSFHGDAEKLDFDQRAKLRLVKAITGDALPYAILMYVWANELPVETVVPSPHFDRIKLIVVEQGEANLGRWRDYRRDIFEDYRRAFGEEPGDIVSVGVLTDADNTQHVARALYGDITLRAR